MSERKWAKRRELERDVDGEKKKDRLEGEDHLASLRNGGETYSCECVGEMDSGKRRLAQRPFVTFAKRFSSAYIFSTIPTYFAN